MYLGHDLEAIIGVLEEEDPRKVVPLGFNEPHSYRGDYYDLAFEPAENVTVGEMLSAARSAVGATFEGYKGGQFTMGMHTGVWLAYYGGTGETLGVTLLRLMLERGSVPDRGEEDGEG